MSAKKTAKKTHPKPPIPAVIKHLEVRVHTWPEDGLQRITLRTAHLRKPPETFYLTIQDAEYLIGQLPRAIKRAPRAR